MQLNEILEENSAKSISQKTSIPEEKIEYLFTKEFDKLNKVHALGFVSIIEREFNADLTSLKEEINAYYEEHGQPEVEFTVGIPLYRNKRKSKWFFMVILIALVFATWYFLTQYDKTHLNTIFPVNDESTLENSLEERTIIGEGDLNIINVIKKKWANVTKQNRKAEEAKDEAVIVDNTSPESISVVEEQLASVDTEAPKVEESHAPVISKAEAEQNETVEGTEMVDKADEKKVALVKTEIFIIPVNRLWFGLIDLETKKREHYTISEKFTIDITKHAWLAATSSAPFSLDDGVERKMFQDAKEHYFKIDREGIKELSKAEYIALGGWHKW